MSTSKLTDVNGILIYSDHKVYQEDIGSALRMW